MNKKIVFLNKNLKNKKFNNTSLNEINNDNLQNQNENYSKEILILVKEKFQLFGPEINNYDYQDTNLGKDIFG